MTAALLGAPARTAFSFALAISLVTPAAPVGAQPAAAEAKQAQAKFEQAQAHYKAGKFAQALDLFREAHAATGSPNARLYVARCLREMGKLPEAWEEMRLTVRDSQARGAADKRYAETQRAAEAERAALEAKIGRVVIVLPENAPAEARVTLDGEAIAADRLGQPIARNPGPATIEATAPGVSTFSRRVELAAAAEERVQIELSSTAAVPDRPVEPEKSGGQVRVAGFIVAGVGVAAMGLFAVAGLSAKSKFDTIVDECGGRRCTDPKYGDEIDSGQTLTTLANVGLIAGIVGIAAGTTMIVLGGPKATTPATGRTSGTSSVAIGVTPWGGSVSGRF